jgi:hypothetical protein
LWNTRVRTVDYIIELRADDDESDVAIWKWLRDVLQILGAEGMSTDESGVDDDDFNVIYRVTIKAWRRPEITEYMQQIDKERLGEDSGFSAQGAQPHRRVRDYTNAESSRTPTKCLPRALYDDSWFNKNHRKFSLNVSKEQFQWLKIAAK